MSQLANFVLGIMVEYSLFYGQIFDTAAIVMEL